MQLSGSRLPLFTRHLQRERTPELADAVAAQDNGLRLTPVAAVILLAGMHLSLRNWTDYDLFWHLSNGRLMVRDGISPSPDRFSWAGAGRVERCTMHGPTASFTCSGTGTAQTRSPSSPACFCWVRSSHFALLIGRLGLTPITEAGAILLMSTAYLPFLGARPHLLGVWMLGVLALVLEQPFGAKRAVVAGIAVGAG